VQPRNAYCARKSLLSNENQLHWVDTLFMIIRLKFAQRQLFEY
jgi:hypothetical protein